MRGSILVLMSAIAGACSAGPDAADAEQMQQHESDAATKAAELAVKVANGSATPEERARLDAYLSGKK